VLATTLVIRGLYPFERRRQPVPMRWIPFTGFLDGPMLGNATTLFEKFFAYGSLIRLQRDGGAARRAAARGALILTGGLELAQTRFAQHTAETTDPVLVLLTASAFFALELRRPTAPA
jgi:hypothetical protein